MKHSIWAYASVLLVVAVATGCARAARDTSGFAIVDSAAFDAPAETVWQTTKVVLRDLDLDIYTRDKRGTFVAFSGAKRHLFVPHRTKYSITLQPISADATRLSIETVRQVYGVTLLTYPDWHDRKATDNKIAMDIIEGVKAKLAH
ncbi:MAG TPA: hypothetical protein PLO62_06980 [Candidatus Hydrogenedentes bacterium]|nr:hypothetical protein [Candidatus Hydrogenedentota bacterium]